MSELRVDNIVSENGSAAPVYSKGMTIGAGQTLTCSGDFTVGGDVTFNSGATVTGVVTFSSADLQTNLSVSSLNVSGVSTFSDTVNVGAGKSIKLNGASSGYTEIVAAAGSGSTTFVLPANGGSASQYLQTDGSGVLSWQNVEGLPDAIDVNASAPANSINIDASGRVGIVTTSPSAPLEVESAGTSSVINPAIKLHTPNNAGGGLTGSSLLFSALNSSSAKFTTAEFASRLDTNTAGSENAYLTIDIPQGSGLTRAFTIANTIFAPLAYNQTTSSGANVYIHGNGGFLRVTSSIKYKTDVETLEDSYADALLECRPVWYRSLSANDNPDHGYWGFIAEEVAEIDPRLVYWKTVEVTKDENGETIEVPCEPEPEGVQYDRFVPHLINLVKRQKEQLESQAATIASLEARLTALEGA